MKELTSKTSSESTSLEMFHLGVLLIQAAVREKRKRKNQRDGK
jgi:hypothetical protein